VTRPQASAITNGINDFNLPLDPQLHAWQDRNLVELLTEEDLSERCEWFSTIQEAIERHDRDFQNSWDS